MGWKKICLRNVEWNLIFFFQILQLACVLLQETYCGQTNDPHWSSYTCTVLHQCLQKPKVQRLHICADGKKKNVSIESTRDLNYGGQFFKYFYTFTNSKIGPRVSKNASMQRMCQLFRCIIIQFILNIRQSSPLFRRIWIAGKIWIIDLASELSYFQVNRRFVWVWRQNIVQH